MGFLSKSGNVTEFGTVERGTSATTAADLSLKIQSYREQYGAVHL
jgi:hypothetical protein